MGSNENEGAKAAASAAGRGSSYPFIDLKEAISRIQKFYDKEGKAAAPISAAVMHWNYSEKSSGGRQTVSTLIQYGLLRDEGSAEQRKVALTRRALDIILHVHGSPEWLDAVRAAAKAPKLFAEILTKYSDTGLPSDVSLRHFLITEKSISIASVDTFIKNLRANIAFAKLDREDNVPPKAPPPSGFGQELDMSKKVEVGDFVQWESGGAIQFDNPRRVRAVVQHEGADWLFVDGSETGIPMGEVTIEQKGSLVKTVSPSLACEPVRPNPNETEWLRGPLSKDLSYRLLVTGDIGPKEISKLIKILEAQRLVLLDDDEL